MEQNLNSFQTVLTERPKKKISRTKLILIMIVISFAVLLIAIYFSFGIIFKLRVIEPLSKAAETEYTADPQSERGGRTYYKNVTIENKEASLSMKVPSDSGYSAVFVLKTIDPIEVDSNLYDIHIMFSTNKYPWDKHYFLSWSNDGNSSTIIRSAEINEDGELRKDEYSSTTPSERELISMLKPSYLPMLEYIKDEYNRLTDDH